MSAAPSPYLISGNQFELVFLPQEGELYARRDRLKEWCSAAAASEHSKQQN